MYKTKKLVRSILKIIKVNKEVLYELSNLQHLPAYE